MTKYKKIDASAFPGTADCILSAEAEAVLKTLAYFDIFQYPLTFSELQQFAPVSIPSAILSQTLAQLIGQKRIYQYADHYSPQNNPLLVYRRKDGNARAVPLLKKAARIGRFLYQFPFVTAVGVSGSLSKNFADSRADIDFFIITKANRLWIARTLMHLYKKLTFLRGRQHYYCMNYYIDTHALTLSDRNIFTAIEIKTLLPVCGEKSMKEFFANNAWANEWLPRCNWRTQTYTDPRPSGLKRFTEWLIAGKLASGLNNWLCRLTTNRWKKKEARKKRNEKGMLMGLVTGIHFAKSNAGDFQGKVLASYEQTLLKLFADTIIK